MPHARTRRSAQLLLLVAALGVQVMTARLAPTRLAVPAEMPAPPSTIITRGLHAGEREFVAGMIVLALQAFDDQPGMDIPLRELDYGRLIGWLQRALDLDADSEYPLLLAGLVYAQVPDAGRQRLALDFVHKAFLAEPNRRWRWLAHAAIVARHRLGDDALALRYAKDITTYATAAASWARQMHIFILEDLGEREHARLLITALLLSGEVTDSHEIRFLKSRLEALTPAPRESARRAVDNVT